jgi:hypothetical protein
MNKLPFDPYDFFGYLSSGLFIIVGLDVVLGFPHILGQDFKIVESALLIIATYVVGQIIATPARALLEDGIVGEVLERPNINLFREKKPRIRSLLFPGFYQPLPTQTRMKILRKAQEEGVKGTGEDLFLHVRYSQAVVQDQKLGEKLNSFINKYGFGRNLSFSALLFGIGCLIKIILYPDSNSNLIKYGITALIAAIFLFYRYLKFYRQYSYEMFNFYAGAK